MNNKRTLTIEINGGSTPHIVMHLSKELAQDDRINKLADLLKVEVGMALIDAMKPITDKLGFGASVEEARADAEARKAITPTVNKVASV